MSSKRVAFLLTLPLLFFACGGKLWPEDGTGAGAVPGTIDDDDGVGKKKTPQDRDDDDIVQPTPTTKQPTDLDDPKIAAICAEQATRPRGKFLEESTSAYEMGKGFTFVKAALGAARLVDGHYESTLALTFTAESVLSKDPAHGLTRTDAGTSYTIVLSKVLPADPFAATGVAIPIEVRGGFGFASWCHEDGTIGGQGGSASGEAWKGQLTITGRTSTNLSAVLETATYDGTTRIVFDAPIISTVTKSVCCLKN